MSQQLTYSFAKKMTYYVDPEAQVFLERVVERYHLHAQVADWEAHAWIYRRLSFAIMRGVAEQFVRRMSDDFGW